MKIEPVDTEYIEQLERAKEEEIASRYQFIEDFLLSDAKVVRVIPNTSEEEQLTPNQFRAKIVNRVTVSTNRAHGELTRKYPNVNVLFLNNEVFLVKS